MRQVHFLDQPKVIHHPPNCWSLELVVEPIDGVDLVDRCQVHVSDRKCGTQLDQSVDVPCVKAVLAGPEVILLSHLRSIAPRTNARCPIIGSSGAPDDNLRHGVKPQVSGWSFETLDGASYYNPGARYGPTNFHVRRAPKAMVSLGDQVSIFYEDDDDHVLRHAFKRTGLPWMFESVDGDVAYGGRVRSAVQTPVAVVRDGFVNLIYYDAGRSRLRHAVLSQ